MRNHRWLGALTALGLCLCMPHGTVQAGDKVEVYYTGSVMNFGLAKQRVTCSSIEAVQQLIERILQKYGDKKAYPLLRKLMVTLPGDVTIPRDEILAMPEVTRILNEECEQATGRLFVVGATHIYWIDGHEAWVTAVYDDQRRRRYGYFFDIRVLFPLPGSKEYSQAQAVLDSFKHPSASSIKDGIWRPAGEPR